MSEKIVQLNEEIIKGQLKELVRGSIVGDKCMGMLEAVGEVFPDAKYQRCTVHFYRNVFSVVPKSKVKIVAKMLKAIHAQESKKASREKAKAVVAELRAIIKMTANIYGHLDVARKQSIADKMGSFFPVLSSNDSVRKQTIF